MLAFRHAGEDDGSVRVDVRTGTGLAASATVSLTQARLAEFFAAMARVYVALEPLHRIEIDPDACTYPGCTACLMYCPAEGSIVEAETGRSMVPPPPEAWREA